jgi:hypothetical protein
MITVLIMIGIFWVVNVKTHSVGFLEYLSFKQFKIDYQNNNMHVKMTRIESGVTFPKGLFTLYMNVKIVATKIFWPP